MSKAAAFEGKRIWITGASSGIGAALAKALAARGARLVLSARRRDRLESVRDECERPQDHVVLPLDVTETAALSSAAQQVNADVGPVDVLINNSGISQRGRVLETDLEVVRRIMEVNFFGAVALTRAVLPSMLERQSGHIVVVSSLVGKFGTPLRSSYAASKHALHGFFDALRAEVYDAGVDVTIVCPGFVRTDISRNALTGGGETYGVMDDRQAAGMPPEVFAEKMLRAVARRREEVYIGGEEKLLVYVKRFLPGLHSRLMRRLKVT